jgi:hypothetical protein
MALWTPQNILAFTRRKRVMQDEPRGDVNGYEASVKNERMSPCGKITDQRLGYTIP